MNCDSKMTECSIHLGNQGNYQVMKANIRGHMSIPNTLKQTQGWQEVEIICESQWCCFAIKSKENKLWFVR